MMTRRQQVPHSIALSAPTLARESFVLLFRLRPTARLLLLTAFGTGRRNRHLVLEPIAPSREDDFWKRTRCLASCGSFHWHLYLSVPRGSRKDSTPCLWPTVLDELWRRIFEAWPCCLRPGGSLPITVDPEWKASRIQTFQTKERANSESDITNTKAIHEA